MFALLTSLALSRLYMLHEERTFVEWMRSTNQLYTGSEYHFRLGLFMANCKYITEFNKQKKGFQLTLNKFAAYTRAEYASLQGGLTGALNTGRTAETRNDVPESLDWRESNVVGSVRDQGQCGGCWAFAAVCSAESACAIKTGNFIAFSEQNIIDCATNCHGCNGGWASKAIDYVVSSQSGSFNTAEDYPYVGGAKTCHYDSSKAVGSISGYSAVKASSETDLQAKIATYGTAAACIDASVISFQLYSGGIFSDESCSTLYLDHYVSIVGYGRDGETDFWIVKNTWGSDWGEAGYIRMARNNGNMCGIATEALVALI